MYEIICNHTNIKFLIRPHELQKDLAASRKFSCSHLVENGFFIFLYHNVVLYYVSQDFGGSVSVSAIAREKTSEMSDWGAGKCLHFCNSKSL